jgi:hypothetical protein
MTNEEHSKLLIELHQNQAAAETKILNRLKYWEDRRDMMLEKFGKLEEMTEAQKLNFEVIANTIIDIRSYQKAMTAIYVQYQCMYMKQVAFIQKVYEPGFRMSVINKMMQDVNEHIKPLE